MSQFGDDLRFLTESEHRRRECFSVLCPIGICISICCSSKYFWQPKHPESYLRPFEIKLLNSLCPECEKKNIKFVFLNSRLKKTKKFVCFECQKAYSPYVHSLKTSNEKLVRKKSRKQSFFFLF